MKKFVMGLLIKMSSNAFIQSKLENIVALFQILMGIGSGTGVVTSGEHVLISLLSEQYASDEPICIFDVGSNQGQFCEMLEQGLQGKSFLIHSFEPSKYTFNSLKSNLEKYSNIIFNNIGIGKEIGELQLYYDKPGSGLASLSQRRLDHFDIDFNLSETVIINTIDNYCAQHKIDRIDLLKLDIEGHELDALHGAVNMLKDQKINMISFEFGGCNIDTRTFFQDFYYFLEAHGMKKLYRITPSGYLFQIDNYKETNEQFRTTNFLARFK